MFLTALALVAMFGLFCWILFTLAVYALPFFVAVMAGLFAYESGAGPIGAILVGATAGTVTLIAGQTLFALFRSPVLRWGLALAFAAPAAFAGYHATHGLTALFALSDVWEQICALASGCVTGFVAWSRFTSRCPDYPERGGDDGLPLPLPTNASNDR